MTLEQRIRDIVLFVSLYLVFSLPLFLLLNFEVLGAVRERIAIDVITIAISGAVLFVVFAGLMLSREGVDRYTQFLLAPTDVLSVFVELAFLLAAVSWWLVPEIVFYFELDWGLDLLLAIILACQLPMILFLSLMTAIGKA
jgi:hypothetical protein